MQDAGWKKLCREIMNEQEPEKLFALADALNRALEHPGARLDERREEIERVAVC
jgi:hypothetical protein